MHLSLLLALAAAAPHSTIQMMERRDVALVVLTPFGASPSTRSSDIIEAAARAFEDTTDLRVLPATQAGVDETRLLGCPAARRVDCWLDTAAEARVVMLLMVTVVPSKTGVQASVWAFQLPSRRRTRIDGLSLDDPEAMFRGLVGHRLRSFLDAMDAFAPHGAVEVETDCLDCSVTIGARPPTVIGPGRTVLTGLPFGTTSIEVRRGFEVVCRDVVNVDAAAPAALRCDVPLVVSRNAQIATLSGAGIAASVGIVLVVWSAALASGENRLCLQRSMEDCDFGPSARPGGSAGPITPLATGGVPIAPIGIGLVAGGATAGVTTALLVPEDWWIGALAGVGVALAASAAIVATE